MALNYYLPRDDQSKSLWLQNFVAKLPGYAIKYGIESQKISDLQADSEFFTDLLYYKNRIDEYSRKLTAYKKEVRDNSESSDVSIFPAPPLPNFNAPTSNGIFKRATNIANRIKGHLEYTVSDGMDLGLIGIDPTSSMKSVTCEIALRLAAGGHPEIIWKKQSFTSIEIWADRMGDGKFERIDITFKPNYIDKHPLPPSGISAIWAYKAIYRKGDEQIGQWSSVKTISVNSAV